MRAKKKETKHLVRGPKKQLLCGYLNGYITADTKQVTCGRCLRILRSKANADGV